MPGASRGLTAGVIPPPTHAREYPRPATSQNDLPAGGEKNPPPADFRYPKRPSQCPYTLWRAMLSLNRNRQPPRNPGQSHLNPTSRSFPAGAVGYEPLLKNQNTSTKEQTRTNSQVPNSKQEPHCRHFPVCPFVVWDPPVGGQVWSLFVPWCLSFGAFGHDSGLSGMKCPASGLFKMRFPGASASLIHMDISRGVLGNFSSNKIRRSEVFSENA